MDEIDWSVFETQEDRLKFRPGETHEVGFNGAKITQVEVQRSGEAETRVITALELEIDMLDGKATQKKFLATSKQLISTIRTFYENRTLFDFLFQITRQGEGFQTKYFLVPVRKKEKKFSSEVKL